jgi:hypothetical protein
MIIMVYIWLLTEPPILARLGGAGIAYFKASVTKIKFPKSKYGSNESQPKCFFFLFGR